MKKAVLHIFLCLCAFPSFSQGVLHGTIWDENKTPLAGANVLLKEINMGQVTDALGKFHFQHVKPGKYIVSISFIGYHTKTDSINIQDGVTSQLNVELQPGAVQLSDVAVTSSPDHAINTLSQIDIKLRPVNTSQDVLRMVPGLFIAQHAGGGKAEQIFLRGFDCDHGTDINLSVDGLPVNMVSHAHGQGYSDLHFVIPETIESADFNKGPYYADKGNFNTAGYVAFKLKNAIDQDLFKLEGGQYGFIRGLALVNLINRKTSGERFKQSAFVASEYARTNGFFVNSQDFSRLNILGKYSAWINNKDFFNVTLSAFNSQWNASGQIPERAVESGMISRFGSIDPTEGGNTQRLNASFKQAHTFANDGVLENQVYFSKYDFNLYSNFTFYLKDPINGDQINQAESRNIFGYQGSYFQESTWLGKKLTTYVGAGLRNDHADNLRLTHTIKRNYLNDIKRGDLDETNASAFISETVQLSPAISLNAALRYDYFNFGYTDKLNGLAKKTVGVGVVSPKVNLNFALTPSASVYVKFGQGFHSNDARAVVVQGADHVLPQATGFDLGTIWKPTQNLVLNVAAWLLDLQQEFVYVGDDAIVEQNGRSRRVGVDFSLRYQFTSLLFADIDMNATNPRLQDAPADENYIPLAPVFSSIGGLTIKNTKGWNGSLRYRYLANRPANEGYSLTAHGYFVTDAIVNYTWKKLELGISAENIFDVSWKEAQFATTSSLKNEAAPVEEIHFTPGTPFFVRAKVSFSF